MLFAPQHNNHNHYLSPTQVPAAAQKHRPASPTAEIDFLIDPSYARSSSSSSSHGSPQAPSIYLGELHDPDFRMFPPIAPTTHTQPRHTTTFARDRAATHPPAAKRRRTAFGAPVYAAGWLDVEDDDEDEDDEESNSEAMVRRMYPSQQRQAYHRSTAPPSPALPSFNAPLPPTPPPLNYHHHHHHSHSHPTTTTHHQTSSWDLTPASFSPRPASHLTMLSDASSRDDEDAAAHPRRRCLMKLHHHHQAEDDDEEQDVYEDELIAREEANSPRDDDDEDEDESEGGHDKSPTCAHAIRRQYHALSFRVQLAVFRTRKRVKARLGAGDAGS